MKLVTYVIGLMAIIFSLTQCAPKEEGPAKVEVVKNTAGNFTLQVNGKAFYVNGAGLEFGQIASLAKHGGNSFRTWRTENGKIDAIEVLDEAHKHGLMVLMGLEVGRQRYGYDYNDTAWVKTQHNYLIGEVERLKHHPALLGWAIGNELNLGQENLKIYDAVNHLSEVIHEIDPMHVTTTTMAGIGKREVDYVKTNCTDIDFLSIQFYGEIENLHKHIENAGWDGPYMVTEWGATGHWEVKRTEWDVAIEPTNKEKAASFIHRYNTVIKADKEMCMGSYVFLWGQKQERTPTWYGTFLEDGSTTETVDAMEYLWTGKWPENRCPSIDSLWLNGKDAYANVKVEANSTMEAQVFYTNHEKDSLYFTWEILPESNDLGWGGDFETRPETIILKEGNSKEKIKAPEKEGAYRLFIFVKDEDGKASTANLPFLVELS